MKAIPSWCPSTRSRNFGPVLSLTFASPAPSASPYVRRGRISPSALSSSGMPGDGAHQRAVQLARLARPMKKSTSSISGSIDRWHSKSVSTCTPPSRQQDLQAEDVAALPRRAQPVGRLRAAQRLARPGSSRRSRASAPSRGGGRARSAGTRTNSSGNGIRPDPDLVEDAWDAHGRKLPVIVATEDLARYRGAVTMVDGGFDPLHPGHIAYFEAAAALGRPVLCNLCPDEWVARKHPPLLAAGRARGAGRRDPLRRLHAPRRRCRPRRCCAALGAAPYAKGADWRGRLPERGAGDLRRARDRGGIPRHGP